MLASINAIQRKAEREGWTPTLHRLELFEAEPVACKWIKPALGHQDSVRTSLRNRRCVGGSGVCSRQRHRAVCGSSPGGSLFGQNANRSCRLVRRRPGRTSTSTGRRSILMEGDRQAFGEEVGIVQVSDCTAAVLPECRWQARMSGRGFQFRRGLQARLHHAFPDRRCGNRQRLRPGR